MISIFRPSNHRYLNLPPSEIKGENFSPQDEDSNYETRNRRCDSSPLPWIISTVCLSILVIALALRIFTLQRHGSYSTGFATEFGPSSSIIELIKVPFEGTIAYTDSGRMYVDSGEGKARYVGKPSPEVDLAWSELIGDHETFQMSKEEAEKIPGDPFEDPRDGYIVGPDVLHTLHCVNEIRKLFDAEYYFNTTINNLSRLARMHADHCLNHIRQSIQCHMDLTPEPMIFFESANVEVVDFDRTHTCRDISKLREWVKYRKSIESKLSADPEIGGGGVNGPFRGYLSEENMNLPWTW